MNSFNFEDCVDLIRLNVPLNQNRRKRIKEAQAYSQSDKNTIEMLVGLYICVLIRDQSLWSLVSPLKKRTYAACLFIDENHILDY